MRRVVYHVEARVDVLEIVEYYEREGGPELADRFTAELESFILMVAERPLAYREFKKVSDALISISFCIGLPMTKLSR